MNAISKELYQITGGVKSEEDLLLCSTTGDYYDKLNNYVEANKPKE
jgi:hypothetical protein